MLGIFMLSSFPNPQERRIDMRIFTREMIENYLTARTQNAIKKIEPMRNAVIITFDENKKASVTMECKDYDMEYFLVQQCRKVLSIF